MIEFKTICKILNFDVHLFLVLVSKVKIEIAQNTLIRKNITRLWRILLPPLNEGKNNSKYVKWH